MRSKISVLRMRHVVILKPQLPKNLSFEQKKHHRKKLELTVNFTLKSREQFHMADILRTIT
jgi:hypothetical protein